MLNTARMQRLKNPDIIVHIRYLNGRNKMAAISIQIPKQFTIELRLTFWISDAWELHSRFTLVLSTPTNMIHVYTHEHIICASFCLYFEG